MRTLLIISSLLLLTACYTKQQAIRKFCVSSNKDTIITIHDSVQLHHSQIDTVFLQQHTDTIVVENDEVRVEYIRYRDTVYLRGIAKPRTIYITKEIPIKVSVPCPQPPSLPWWHKYLVAMFVMLLLAFGVISYSFKI